MEVKLAALRPPRPLPQAGCRSGLPLLHFAARSGALAAAALIGQTLLCVWPDLDGGCVRGAAARCNRAVLSVVLTVACLQLGRRRCARC